MMKDVLNTKQLKEKKEQNVAKKFTLEHKIKITSWFLSIHFSFEKCMNCDESL
jgi:hypothetical protein